MRLPTRGRATRPGAPMARCDGDHPRRDGPGERRETPYRVASDRHGVAAAGRSARHGPVVLDEQRPVLEHQRLNECGRMTP